MYSVDYLPSARVDILEAEIYLFEHSPSAADKFAEAIEKQTDLLAEHPMMYPLYKEDERFRLMPLPYEYLGFYRVDETAETLTVHRVIRGMRDIPNIL
jgi:plasmid stabilization system protein ParE